VFRRGNRKYKSRQKAGLIRLGIILRLRVYKSKSRFDKSSVRIKVSSKKYECLHYQCLSRITYQISKINSEYTDLVLAVKFLFMRIVMNFFCK